MRRLLGVTWLALLLAGCDSGTSPVAPDMTQLRLEANPRNIAVDGSSTITITAIDKSGVPARSGTEILLSTTLGSLEERVHTDHRGIAYATLQATGRAGTATVTANSGKAAAATAMVVIGSAMPQALKANFTPTVGESLTVAFEDTSEGNPTSWEWDFGDGKGSAEQNPTHTYAAAGSYVVALRVRNPDGQDSKAQRITVPASETTPPVANFTVAAVSGLQASFTDTSQGKVTRWDWDFGDGARDTVRHPVHLYRQPGIYSVTLVVGNAAGTSTFSRSVTVPESQAPSADFEFQEVENRRVLFRDKSTQEPTSWEWSFGDGGTSREQNPAHTYLVSGTYTVGLTVGNLVGRSTTTQFVTVRGPLVADFSVRFNGHTAIFTDDSKGGPTSFEWNFGDNSAKSTERNPVHAYAAPGAYTVTLTVTRPVGGGSSASEQAVVTKTIQVP